jgi:hypothetical protein
MARGACRHEAFEDLGTVRRCVDCKIALGRPYLDVTKIQNATFLARQFLADATRKVLEAKQDARRVERLAACECSWCFYFRSGRISGQGFTAWNCAGCGAQNTYHNTSVPKACKTCSKRFRICVSCLADLKLAPRRKKLERST